MKLYILSLKDSQERRSSIQKQLQSIKIKFKFFDAVNGRATPPSPLFEKYNYRKRLWLTSGRLPLKGEIGCFASHYLLWEKCVELNEPILILEDDVRVVEDISNYIEIIENKTNEYGFLRLEPELGKCKLYLKEKKENYEIYYMDNNWGGTTAYSISPSAARKLLKGSESWYMPVDNYIGSIYIHHMPSYLFKPNLVENPEEFTTTIQNEKQNKAALYRKPTRELYSLYKKLIMKIKSHKYK